MSKKYKFVIKGKDFKIIDHDFVKILKTAAGPTNPAGRRTFGKNAYLLQSDTAHDILDAVRNKGWAHSSPFKAKEGMTIYVVPSKSVEDTYGEAAVGVKFTATTDSKEDEYNEFVWASE